jgi:hypothetical protein
VNRTEESLRVLERRPNQDIRVAGESWRAVICESVSAHDNEFNAMGSQAPDELVEVWREIYPPVSGETLPPPNAPREAVTASHAGETVAIFVC